MTVVEGKKLSHEVALSAFATAKLLGHSAQSAERLRDATFDATMHWCETEARFHGERSR